MAGSPTIPEPGAEQLSGRAASLKQVSNRLSEMIELLKADRERLDAHRAAAGLADPPPPGEVPATVRAELASLREEEGRLRSRLQEIERLRQSASDELVGLQEHIAHAIGLHVALRRLHEAEDRAAVVEAIQDIVVNIVGSEQMAVLAPGPGGGLELAAGMGEEGRVGGLDGRALAAALERGEILAGEGSERALPGALACVPLRAHGQPAGLLLLFGLLPQKAALGPQDLEVLELLQVHGALALRAAAAEESRHGTG
ncbi:MAG: hypothetical protein HZB56_11825 [Deltaproteobacteria bacterium]|nr:hypothetical protein [Deltaproteobacteria bacterium]